MVWPGLAEDRATTLVEDPMHLGENRFLIGDMVEGVEANDAVDGAIGNIQSDAIKWEISDTVGELGMFGGGVSLANLERAN
jgi:hypothetical protein